MGKRATTRFVKNIPVELTIKNKSYDKIKGWIVDISKDGFKIFSDSYIPENSLLNLNIDSTSENKILNVKAEVVWNDIESGVYGVRFFDIDKQERQELNRFIEDNILGLVSIKASLKTKIRLYKRRAKEIEEYLKQNPEEWGKFQNEFNNEINGIFEEIMNFEKENIINGEKDKVDKLKQIFVKKFQKLFKRGHYFKWSIDKPYGYVGDFKIIDDIYVNSPSTTGFERLFDNYLEMSAICVAVRNRKEDFKRMVIDFIKASNNENIRIMNLACGSAREVKELLNLNNNENLFNKKQVIFDCYDNDKNSLEYARNLVNGFPNVNIYKGNAYRMAVDKDVVRTIGKRYNIIYSSGLFDYLNHKVSTKLVSNLRKLLKKNGVILVSNVRDKYSNPSVHCMEWVGEWELNYRTDEEFKKIFIDAGFNEKDLKIKYEQQGIMQYIIAQDEK